MSAATAADLIDLLDRSRENLMAAIEGLTEEQAARQAMDGWSVKDHLTHLTVWDEMRFFEINRIARGGAPSVPEVGEEAVGWLNEGFARLRRRLPMSQVMADLDFSKEMIKEAVRSAPPERLDPALYGEIGPVGGHEALHAGIIRTWRKKEGI